MENSKNAPHSHTGIPFFDNLPVQMVRICPGPDEPATEITYCVDSPATCNQYSCGLCTIAQLKIYNLPCPNSDLIETDVK